MPYKGEGEKYPSPDIPNVPQGSGTDYSHKYVNISAAELRDKVLGGCANYCSAKLRASGVARKGSGKQYHSCVSDCVKQSIANIRGAITVPFPFPKE